MTRAIGADEVEVVLDARAAVGEGPVWVDERAELLWVDIPRGLVHRYDPKTGSHETLAVGQPVGAVARRVDGGLVLAVRDGFALLDPGEHEVRLISSVERENEENRMNDGRCDSGGRFWAGTMAFDMRPRAGALYRLDENLRVEKVLDGVSVSNGIGWSLDDTAMYFIDSGAHGVDEFDYDAATGTIANRRRLVDVSPEVGLPDGMAVDAEGHLWVAIWGGSAVHRYRPDGTLGTVVHLPAAQITSCAFGGRDLGDLYVTSARDGLGAGELAEQPHAGALFRVRPGVIGRAAHPFKG